MHRRRWVRSVSTVRELDRASGPLVGPMPARLYTYTDANRRAAASFAYTTNASELPRVASPRLSSLECTPCERARARVLRECAWLLATRSRFRSVFARRGASPSVAASRPAKILARSVCSFASFPLSLAPRSSGAPVLPLSTASRPFATARVPFSPFQSLRRKVPSRASPRPVPPTGGDPALRLHRRYCGREDFDEERREFLKRLKK